MLEGFKHAAPLRASIHRPHSTPKGMLEISIMDLHLGKYCVAAETGSRSFDADTAETMFITAVEDLLTKAGRLPIEKILFVCGYDFLNTNDGKFTLAQTIQDECLRYQESFV